MTAFSGVSSQKELLELLDGTYDKRKRKSGFPPLRLFMMHSEIAPGDIVTVNEIDPKFSITINPRRIENLLEFTVERNWGGKNEKETAFILNDENKWIIACAGNRPVLIKGLLYRLQPLLTPVRMNSEDFLQLSSQMARDLKHFEIRDALLRLPNQSLKPFRNIDIDYLESLVRKEHRWIQNIGYFGSEDDNYQKTFQLSVDRRGVIDIFRGYVSLAIERIVNPIFTVSEKRLSSLQRKQTPKDWKTKITPAQISFRDILGKSEINSIIEALKNLGNMHYCIAHEGNPYLLMHLLDSIDGSSLDLLANGKNIYLIPVQHVSPNSYMRIADALFGRLHEGVLVTN